MVFGETSVPHTGGANAVDRIFKPIKNIYNILSSQAILDISIQAKNKVFELPFKYFSGRGISIKFKTA